MKVWIFLNAIVAVEFTTGFAVLDGRSRRKKPHFIWLAFSA